MPDLDDVQYNELTGGGPTDLHHHPKNVVREDIIQYQDATRLRTVSADYAVTYEDDVVIVDTSAGNVTVTLPLALGQKEFTIVKASTLNTVIIHFSGGQTCFTIVAFTLTNLADTKRLKGFNGNWTTI